MSNAARKGYSLAKVLRSPRFCPRVYLYQHEDVLLEQCTLSAQDCISSYMLKNALFHAHYKFGSKEAETGGHDQNKDDDVILWAYRIYDEIFSFLMQQCEMGSDVVMQSYLLPTYIKKTTDIALPMLVVTLIKNHLNTYLHSKQ